MLSYRYCIGEFVLINLHWAALLLLSDKTLSAQEDVNAIENTYYIPIIISQAPPENHRAKHNQSDETRGNKTKAILHEPGQALRSRRRVRKTDILGDPQHRARDRVSPFLFSLLIPDPRKNSRARTSSWTNTTASRLTHQCSTMT